jgi:hypothetical protein
MAVEIRRECLDQLADINTSIRPTGVYLRPTIMLFVYIS